MKILVTGSLKATEKDIKDLEALGHEITLHPDERVPVDHPEQYEGIIGNSLFYYGDYSGFTALKYFQATSVGLDRLPLDWLRGRDVELHNAEGVYSAPMAEWTVMRILELLKLVPAGFRAQLNGQYKKSWKWDELGGKTVLLAGFGAYGREIAKRLKPFGPKILVVNRSVKSDPNVDEFHLLSDLPALLPQADILILAMALTNETRHIISRDLLESMKPGSLLINAARGPLIDEEALIEALKNGPLAGAALDVFEKEPLAAESPLWKLENVLLSPHNSFVGSRNHERMMRLVLGNLQRYGE
ncbi:MAG: hydroxyacid dehydrogenase [Lachnospiraceae bacterium]|nr:hydroxyacid dehydrogenase [Lachnospiraceae bacterium]